MYLLKKIMITGVLFCVSETILAQNTHEKELAIQGEPMLSSDQFIADREVNYDVNGQLAAGLLIKTSLKDLTIQSTLGVLSTMGYENSVLVLLSPEENRVNIYKEGIAPLDIILSEAGIEPESGKVWEISVVERPKHINSGELKILKELEYLKNERVANRRENKNTEGILAAGLKIYSEWDDLMIRGSDPDKILGVKKENGFYVVYIIPDIQEVEVSLKGKKPLVIDLGQTALESGSVYSLSIE